MTEHEQLPDDLIQHLRRQRRTAVLVPREVDRAVLDQAAAHFRRRATRRGPARRYLALAATLLVAVLALRQFALERCENLSLGARHDKP